MMSCLFTFEYMSIVTGTMRKWCVIVFVLIFISKNGITFGEGSDKIPTPYPLREAEDELAEGEMLLSEQILKILEHFQQENPVGLPGVEIPDPLPIPDMEKSFAGVDMTLTKVILKGLNKLKIIAIHAELADMELSASLKIESLHVSGHYVRSTWLTKDEGPFTVNLTDIYVECLGSLGIERDGKLQVNNIDMDIVFKSINLNFENLNFFANMVQGFLNSMGTFIFSTIKPYILMEADTKIRAKINGYLDEIAGDMQFPNSISPLDMVIVDVRKKIRDMGIDPYKIKDRKTNNGLFEIQMFETWVEGASTVHRVGNVSLNVENRTLIADVELGTQKLEGSTQWSITSLFEIISKTGTTAFSVEYVRARVVMAQPFDTRRQPQLRDFYVELGNIQVRSKGAGMIDYMLEFVVNVFPNLLRYQIVEAIELSIVERLRKELDKLDVDALVKSKLPELDHLRGVTLATILALNHTYVIKNEDDFFQF